jgi:hypothetical protein
MFDGWDGLQHQTPPGREECIMHGLFGIVRLYEWMGLLVIPPHNLDIISPTDQERISQVQHMGRLLEECFLIGYKSARTRKIVGCELKPNLYIHWGLSHDE